MTRALAASLGFAAVAHTAPLAAALLPTLAAAVAVEIAFVATRIHRRRAAR